ncbi:sigma factor [Bacillus phage Shanette]|uniref:Sigma factor n=2 Tax=Siminovitchvirus TaxID=1918721 RepID=S5M4P3_9CAUD|nr:RNA polymerase sigma factor [Bacillus phage JL]YP_009216173.1 RNA polymerase sigma factor [Bacillus phage Shanette]AGR46846.1 sigma factor [Bacillus phage JL]AGR47072.1 sigma factor [Bacillus phage Shanette]
MNDMTPPTHFEPVYLYNKYEPLRRKIYNKFKDQMANNTDREELSAEIDRTFLSLVTEYNPHRGVDFPYYIKKMLDLRIFHWVNKYHKNINRETYSNDDNGIVVEDTQYAELLQRIVDLHSIDPDIQLGEKHRNLMIGLLIDQKTIQQLAEEEGVPSNRLHARLYFLIQKFDKEYARLIEWWGEDLYD